MATAVKNELDINGLGTKRSKRLSPKIILSEKY
jgi:hypothetical protein